MTCTAQQINWGDQIKNDDLENACGTHGREHPCLKLLISCKVKQQLHETVIPHIKMQNLYLELQATELQSLQTSLLGV
jgi:pyrimidine deaminase RibD-like protein